LLTESQKLFVHEFLKDQNGSRAYRVAYPHASSATAASNAFKLLKNENVTLYMEKIKNGDSITPDRVLKELAAIAFANAADYSRVVTGPRKKSVWNGSKREYEEIEINEQYVEFIETDSLPQNKRAAVSAIKETANGIVVELFDKFKALELIGRQLGIFKEGAAIEQEENPLSKLSCEELKRLISND